MKPTIREVAQKSGVSITTVSNYLNGNFGNMSEETKEKIRSAIAELKYYPSIGARSLPRKGNNHTICIVIPHDVGYTFHHPYFAEVMRGVGKVAEEKTYRVMILTTMDKRSAEVNYLKSLGRGLVDGFLFFDIDKNDPYVKGFIGNDIPFMVVGQYDKEHGNYVDVDVVNGSYMAVKHLIAEHSCKTVALIAGPKHMVFTTQIVEGYRKAVKEHGLIYKTKNIYYGEFSIDHGYESGLAIVNGEEPINAVFSTSEQTTAGLLQALRKCNLKVPEDMAVVSFGKNRYNGLAPLSLTTVVQPEFEIGQRVMEKLIYMIENKKYTVEPEVMSTDLEIGASCGCDIGQ